MMLSDGYIVMLLMALRSLSDHEVVLKYAEWALQKKQELAVTVKTILITVDGVIFVQDGRMGTMMSSSTQAERPVIKISQADHVLELGQESLRLVTKAAVRARLTDSVFNTKSEMFDVKRKMQTALIKHYIGRSPLGYALPRPSKRFFCQW